MYKFNAIPIKIPTFYGGKQVDTKVYMEKQTLKNSQENTSE